MSFSVFPVATYCCDEGLNNCDRPTLTTQPDCVCCGPPGDPCLDCLLCCSVFGFIADIITLVPRGCNYGCKYVCEKCKTIKKNTTTQDLIVVGNV